MGLLIKNEIDMLCWIAKTKLKGLASVHVR